MTRIELKVGGLPVFAAALWLSIQPAFAFCLRNDTGAPLNIEAIEGTADFAVDLDNNKKACCQPKDAGCAIGKADIRLSIRALEGDGDGAISVNPKGNINVTGDPNVLKCKANKAGSTIDWASG